MFASIRSFSFCLVVLLTSASQLDSDYLEDDDYFYNERIYYDPKSEITTRPTLFKVKRLGESVTLPCKTSGESASLIYWIHNHVYLSANLLNEYNEGTLDSYNLKVNVTSELEAGPYTCVVLFVSSGQKKITHRIVIVPEDSQENTTNMAAQVNLNQNPSASSSSVTSNSSTKQKLSDSDPVVKAETRVIGYGFLTGISDILNNGFFRVMSRRQQDAAKSSVASLGGSFWNNILVLSISLKVVIDKLVHL